MPDLQKAAATKERILSTIKLKGPSYPTQVARETSISPLFTAAFLSELVKERQLKLSSMKIGSSPIYYVPGQEPQLENFVNYLNSKERDAFEKLKSSEMLEDELQPPAIRVALRSIKDFAIPINVKIDGETKLFWRYSQIPENQTRDRIRQLLSPSNTSQIKKQEEPKTEIKEEKITVKENKLSEEIEEIKEEAIEEKIENQEEEKPSLKQKILKQKKPISSEFAESIKDYLAAKDVEILEEIMIKKKEFYAKVRTDITFGKQEFYLIAKDKKKVNQDDLTIAIQTAQAQKMPALFISPGSLDKNASAYIQEWRNVIKFDKIKI